MTSQIPTPKRTNNKVVGEFYPLQKDELIALRQAKLINNAAFVHLALRYENPFCDRPVEIIPKEFSLKWNIPESSVYKAIVRLKELGLILIRSGKMVIEWIKETLSNVVEDYQSRQEIIRSGNRLSDLAKNYQNEQNESLEALQNIDRSSPQTIQTIQTNQTKVAAEENFSVSQQDAIKLSEDNKSDSLEISKSSSQKDNDSRIPVEIQAKLEELNIPLDAKVSKAIASYHISQVKGAIAHVENTWESIKNPRGVFLYQLPKQPIEERKKQKRYLTAADFGGYTIEHLKSMYPTSWREAAIHFGLEVP